MLTTFYLRINNPYLSKGLIICLLLFNILLLFIFIFFHLTFLTYFLLVYGKNDSWSLHEIRVCSLGSSITCGSSIRAQDEKKRHAESLFRSLCIKGIALFASLVVFDWNTTYFLGIFSLSGNMRKSKQFGIDLFVFSLVEL